LFYRTKSGKPRGIPINTAMYDALIALEPDPKQRLGRLFKKANGAGWERVRTAFELALRRAKIQDFTPRPPAHLCVPCRDAPS
jgi:hypothetical protein